jgi:hypothetical protein
MNNLQIYNQNYYYKNKDWITQKHYEKIKCEICNKVISRQHIANHHKSKRCRQRNTQNENGLIISFE